LLLLLLLLLQSKRGRRRTPDDLLMKLIVVQGGAKNSPAAEQDNLSPRSKTRFQAVRPARGAKPLLFSRFEMHPQQHRIHGAVLSVLGFCCDRSFSFWWE
jgi:hypothetical protein